MSSRQRMLAAIDHKEVDHPPCSFMLYNLLKDECASYTEFILRQLEMGLDPYVEIPPRPRHIVNDYYNLHGLAVHFDPRVHIHEWLERDANAANPIMIKEYHTPAGILRGEVCQTEDWRWGDHVPFLDDFLEPRSLKFLISGMADLDALQYLLAAPSQAEIEAFIAESQPALDLARQYDLLSAGGWGVGADMFAWLYGLQNLVYAIFDQPQFVHRLLDMVADWNRKRMEVIFMQGVDLYIKRAWYENCDFWTPKAYKEFIYPILKADCDLAHRFGCRFGYLITSNCMPLLDMIAEAGVDVLIGVDPSYWNLEAAKQKMKGRVCLWGGVNGHLTLEQGTTGQTAGEVQQAMQLLAPGSGFILSPVDNVRQDTPQARDNVEVLIREWQRLCGTSLS